MRAPTTFGKDWSSRWGEDLDRDPQFHTQRNRAENQRELHSTIAAWVGGIDIKDLLERLEQRQVPANKINNIADIFQDPHIRARENIIETVLKSGRSFATMGIVPKLSESPGRVEFVAPSLGEHNNQIYKELMGLSDDDYTRLKEQGTI